MLALFYRCLYNTLKAFKNIAFTYLLIAFFFQEKNAYK